MGRSRIRHRRPRVPGEVDLLLLPPEEVERPDAGPRSPSFDSGPRESDNWTDPMRDADELVFDVAQRSKWGLGPRNRCEEGRS